MESLVSPLAGIEILKVGICIVDIANTHFCLVVLTK